MNSEQLECDVSGTKLFEFVRVKEEKSVLREKSYAFAIRIVRLSGYLQKEKQDYVISKQVLRSGTSIGAAVRESEYAQSKSDFIHKLSIALKEANETEYWLSLLSDTNYIEAKLYTSISEDLRQLLRILISSINTAKGNNNSSEQ